MDGHVRREAQVRATPKITEYLQNLNLTSVIDMVKNREAGLLLLSKNKHKNFLTEVYGKVHGKVWGTCLHVQDNQTDMTAPSTPNKVKKSKCHHLQHMIY